MTLWTCNRHIHVHGLHSCERNVILEQTTDDVHVFFSDKDEWRHSRLLQRHRQNTMKVIQIKTCILICDSTYLHPIVGWFLVRCWAIFCALTCTLLSPVCTFSGTNSCRIVYSLSFQSLVNSTVNNGAAITKGTFVGSFSNVLRQSSRAYFICLCEVFSGIRLCFYADCVHQRSFWKSLVFILYCL